MSPGKAELGHMAWLVRAVWGRAPAGGCGGDSIRVGVVSSRGAGGAASARAPWSGRARLGLTWKMARRGLAGGRRGVMARLFSLDSHSWMVTILRAGGGRCRWVSRAFFRWWKSPSVSVYLPWGGG